MTKVYIAKTDALSDDNLFKALYNTVPALRREKLEKCALRKDKNLSLGAGVLLNIALEKEGIKAYELLYGEKGRPYIKNNENIFCSISHSEKVAMCVVSDKETGCDVEKIREIDFKIAERFFCREEYNFIADKTDKKEAEDTFFRLWTLKESFMKMTGCGFSLSMKEFKVDISGTEPVLAKSTQEAECFFKEYDFGDGYKYAVCSKASCFGEAEFVDLRKII